MGTTIWLRRMLVGAALLAVVACGGGGGEVPQEGGPDEPELLSGWMRFVTPVADQIVNDLRPPVAIQMGGEATFDLDSLAVRVDGQPADVSSWTRFQFGASGALDGVADGVHTLSASIRTTQGLLVQAESRSFERSTAGGVTTVFGVLLDPEGDEPIEGASIYLEEDPTTVVTTDGEGRYSIAGAMSGLALHICFDPTTITKTDGQSGTYTYPFYKRPIDVLAGAKNNPAPCYLPKIYSQARFQDLANQGIFDCSTNTFLSEYELRNDDLGIYLTIPAGTFVQTRDGSAPCDTYLAIAPVNPQKAPSNMPDTADPGILITIQPTGLRFFDAPGGNAIRIPISFPNVDEIPPGNDIDLFSVDHTTGEFVKMGTMEADAGDPTRLVTTSGGVEGGSWHCPCPTDFPSYGCTERCGNRVGGGPGDGSDQGAGCTNPVVDLRTGHIREDLHLPPTVSYDTPYSPMLVYLSESVAPWALLRMDVTVPRIAAVPRSLSIEAGIDGLPTGKPVHYSAGEFEEEGETTRTLSLPLDIRGTRTGSSVANVIVRSHYAAGSVGSQTDVPLPLYRGLGDHLGRGWSLADDERLVFTDQASDSPTVTVARGDGQLLLFRPEETVGVGTNGLRLRAFGSQHPVTSGLWYQEVYAFHEGKDPLMMRVFERHPDDLAVTDPANEPLLREEWTHRFTHLFFAHCGHSCHEPWLTMSGPNGRLDSDIGSGSILGGRPPLDFTVQGDDYWIQAGSTRGSYPFDRAFMLDGWIMVPQSATYEFSLDFTPNSDVGQNAQNVVRVGENLFDYGGSYSRSFHLDAGPQRLHMAFTRPGMLWIRGGPWTDWVPVDGSITRTPSAVDPDEYVWRSSGEDGSTIVREADDSWRRTWPAGEASRYDAAGRIVERTDSLGRSLVFERDPAGLLTALILPSSARVEFSYDGGKLVRLEFPGGRHVELTYRGGDMTRAVLPDGSVHSYSYDPNGLLTARTDPVGRTTRHEYDEFGRFLRTTYPNGGTRSVNSGASRALRGFSAGIGTLSDPAAPLSRDEGESIMREGNDALVSVTSESLGGEISEERIGAPFGTDSERLVLRTTRERGSERVVARELIERTETGDVTLSRVLIERARSGVPVRVTRSGTAVGIERSVEFQWDSARVVRRTERIDGELLDDIVYTRDAQGRVLRAESLVDGKWVTRAYDGRGSVVARQTSAGSSVVAEYDAAGNTVARAWNGERTEFQRDAAGFITAIVLPTGATTSFEHDPIGRLTATVDAADARWEISRDRAGNAVGVLLPGAGSARHQLDRNDAGQLVEWRRPGGGTTQYEYTARGEVSQILRPDGLSVVYSQNASGRVNRIDFVDGGNVQQSRQFTYSASGRLATISDDTSSVSRTYDTDGRLQTESVAVTGGATSRVSYAYDVHGRRTTVTIDLIDGATSTVDRHSYTHDTRGRLESVVSDRLGAATFIWDNLGRVRQWTAPGGTTTTAIFHHTGQVASTEVRAADGSTLMSDSSVRDSSGRVSRWNRMRPQISGNSIDTVFTYDAVGRLTSASPLGLPPSRAYGPFDARGNDTSAGRTFDLDDRLAGTLANQHTFDSAGRLVAITDRTTGSLLERLVYDARGRLVRHTDVQAGVSVTLEYDALGRLLKIDGGRLIYDGSRVVAFVDAGQAARSVLSGPVVGGYVAMGSTLGTVALHPNLRGDICAESWQGAMNWQIRLAEFGTVLETYGARSAAVFRPSFSRMLSLGSSGLLLAPHRTYSPGLRAWTSEEPLLAGYLEAADTQSINSYSYARGNPIEYADVSGLDVVFLEFSAYSSAHAAGGPIPLGPGIAGMGGIGVAVDTDTWQIQPYIQAGAGSSGGTSGLTGDGGLGAGWFSEGLEQFMGGSSEIQVNGSLGGTASAGGAFFRGDNGGEGFSIPIPLVSGGSPNVSVRGLHVDTVPLGPRLDPLGDFHRAMDYMQDRIVQADRWFQRVASTPQRLYDRIRSDILELLRGPPRPILCD